MGRSPSPCGWAAETSAQGTSLLGPAVYMRLSTPRALVTPFQMLRPYSRKVRAGAGLPVLPIAPLSIVPPHITVPQLATAQDGRDTSTHHLSSMGGMGAPSGPRHRHSVHPCLPTAFPRSQPITSADVLPVRAHYPVPSVSPQSPTLTALFAAVAVSPPALVNPQSRG